MLRLDGFLRHRRWLVLGAWVAVLVAAAPFGARHGVSIHLVGEGALYAGLQAVTKKGLASAEGVGLPVVLLILVAVFGSLAAASLPLLLGLFSVLITGALIFFLSQTMEMSVF